MSQLIKHKLLGFVVIASTLMVDVIKAESGDTPHSKDDFEVAKKIYKFEIGGRIMYDFNRSRKNGIVDENDFDLRRGRITIKGEIADDWAFKNQFNIDGSGFEDVYIRYKGWGRGAYLTVGQQQLPFGLEQLTSSKNVSLLERSAISERFSAGRETSVRLHGKLDNSRYSVAIHNDQSGDRNLVGVSARVSHALIDKKNKVVHIGSGYLNIDSLSALGVEFAAASGPFHVQAETFLGKERNVDINGYYLQGGYVITGEPRSYRGGVFNRVTPYSSRGAWELVARYETGDGNFSDIELGRNNAYSYAVGLNWYAHKDVRIGVNFSSGERRDRDNNGDELRLRFQLTF